MRFSPEFWRWSLSRQGRHSRALAALLALPCLIGCQTSTHPAGARPDYLQAAFAEMVDEHGSIEACLHRGLGVTPEQRKKLPSQLPERKRLPRLASRR